MKRRSFVPHVPVTAVLTLLSLGATDEMLAAADPPGFSSVAKWTLNDTPISTTVVNDYGTGFHGLIQAGQESKVVDAVRTASDTPPYPEAGASILFLGGIQPNAGGKATNSVVGPGSGISGNLFTATGMVGSGLDGDYSFYGGSRTVSAWIKLTEDDIVAGEYRVIFSHGYPVHNENSIDRICQLDDYVVPPVHGQVVTAHACREFALGVYSPSSNVAHIFFGNTHGNFTTHNAAFLLTSTSDCDVNLLSTANAGTWHHIVGVFSKDLMDMGYDSTIVYIDGEKCGTGKIAQPYTDVGSSTSTFRIGSMVDLYPANSTPFSAFPYKGLIDDVRVYDRALGQPAATWLFNNTGRSGN